jgi:hypothetical protein
VSVVDVVAVTIVKCVVVDQSISLHIGAISSLGQRTVYSLSFDYTSADILNQFDNLN